MDKRNIVFKTAIGSVAVLGYSILISKLLVSILLKGIDIIMTIIFGES